MLFWDKGERHKDTGARLQKVLESRLNVIFLLFLFSWFGLVCRGDVCDVFIIMYLAILFMFQYFLS